MPPWQGLELADCQLSFGYDIAVHGSADSAHIVDCSGKTLAVGGTLRVGSHTTIRADRIEVHASGRLLVGSSTSPVAGVTFELRNLQCADVLDCPGGEFVSFGGIVEVYGEPKTAWTRLVAPANALDTIVRVEACDNWTPGDEVIFAATAGRVDEQSQYSAAYGAQANFVSVKRELQTVTPGAAACELGLATPLGYSYESRDLDALPAVGSSPRLRATRIDAEVGNLARSVRFTTAPVAGSDMHWADHAYKIRGAQGITVMHMSEGHMHVEYARVDNCGRMRMGGYCLHFHLVGVCPACKFIGNAITNGINKGITVHGTHAATVQGNVIYDVRGASIYVEDGNEHDNAIDANLLVCPTLSHGATLVGLRPGAYVANADPAATDCEVPAWIHDPRYWTPSRHAISSVLDAHTCELAATANAQPFTNACAPGDFCQCVADATNAYFWRKKADADRVVCNRATGVDGQGHRCMLYGIKEHADSDWGEQSGIYSLAATNRFVGNHVVGHENALYINHQGSRNFGMGAAVNRVCLLAMPFGLIADNTFHNCAGFGFYVNVAFPSQIDAVDEDGAITDWQQCLPFSATADNAQANFVVQNHLEYYNDFGAGGYDLGDLSFERYTSLFNNKGLYLKTYRRGAQTVRPYCSGCAFYKSRIEGAGGSAAIDFVDTHFVQSALQVNHHCGLPGELTGGLCASHYNLSDTALSGPLAPSSLQDDATASMKAAAVVIFSDQTLFRPHLLDADQNRVLGLSASEVATCAHWTSLSAWMACPSDYKLRIVRIYSPDRGPLVVTVHHAGGTDATHQIPYHAVSKGSFAAGVYSQSNKYVYTPHPGLARGRGYTFVVRDGARLSIEAGAALAACTNCDVYNELFAIEYSDQHLGATSITLAQLIIEGQTVATEEAISSSHDRTHVTPYGALLPGAGAVAYTGDATYTFDDFWRDSTVYQRSQLCDETAYCFGPDGAHVNGACLGPAAPVGCAILGQACCRANQRVQFDGGDYEVCSGRHVTVYWGGYHNIYEVTQAEYDACSTDNAVQIEDEHAEGTTIVFANDELAAPNGGFRYFICTVSGHCAAGRKFATFC